MVSNSSEVGCFSKQPRIKAFVASIFWAKSSFEVLGIRGIAGLKYFASPFPMPPTKLMPASFAEPYRQRPSIRASSSELLRPLPRRPWTAASLLADLEAYRQRMARFMYQSGSSMEPVFAAAKTAQRRVAFAEGEDDRVLRAAQVIV